MFSNDNQNKHSFIGKALAQEQIQIHISQKYREEKINNIVPKYQYLAQCQFDQCCNKENYINLQPNNQRNFRKKKFRGKENNINYKNEQVNKNYVNEIKLLVEKVNKLEKEVQKQKENKNMKQKTEIKNAEIKQKFKKIAPKNMEFAKTFCQTFKDNNKKPNKDQCHTYRQTNEIDIHQIMENNIKSIYVQKSKKQKEQKEKQKKMIDRKNELKQINEKTRELNLTRFSKNNKKNIDCEHPQIQNMQRLINMDKNAAHKKSKSLQFNQKKKYFNIIKQRHPSHAMLKNKTWHDKFYQNSLIKGKSGRREDLGVSFLNSKDEASINQMKPYQVQLIRQKENEEKLKQIIKQQKDKHISYIQQKGVKEWMLKKIQFSKSLDKQKQEESNQEKRRIQINLDVLNNKAKINFRQFNKENVEQNQQLQPKNKKQLQVKTFNSKNKYESKTQFNDEIKLIDNFQKQNSSHQQTNEKTFDLLYNEYKKLCRIETQENLESNELDIENTFDENEALREILLVPQRPAEIKLNLEHKQEESNLKIFQQQIKIIEQKFLDQKQRQEMLGKIKQLQNRYQNLVQNQKQPKKTYIQKKPNLIIDVESINEESEKMFIKEKNKDILLKQSVIKIQRWFKRQLKEKQQKDLIHFETNVEILNISSKKQLKTIDDDFEEKLNEILQNKNKEFDSYIDQTQSSASFVQENKLEISSSHPISIFKSQQGPFKTDPFHPQSPMMIEDLDLTTSMEIEDLQLKNHLMGQEFNNLTVSSNKNQKKKYSEDPPTPGNVAKNQQQVHQFQANIGFQCPQKQNVQNKLQKTINTTSAQLLETSIQNYQTNQNQDNRQLGIQTNAKSLQNFANSLYQYIMNNNEIKQLFIKNFNCIKFILPKQMHKLINKFGTQQFHQAIQLSYNKRQEPPLQGILTIEMYKTFEKEYTKDLSKRILEQAKFLSSYKEYLEMHKIHDLLLFECINEAMQQTRQSQIFLIHDDADIKKLFNHVKQSIIDWGSSLCGFILDKGNFQQQLNQAQNLAQLSLGTFQSQLQVSGATTTQYCLQQQENQQDNNEEALLAIRDQKMNTMIRKEIFQQEDEWAQCKQEQNQILLEQADIIFDLLILDTVGNYLTLSLKRAEDNYFNNFGSIV